MHSRQIVRRYLHIIDKDQRIHFTRTEGGDSPDKKLRIVLARFAGSLIGNHTGDTACQGSGQVTGRSTQFLHRSEEHTSELQSRENLVCRLLLEKKKTSRSSVRTSAS